MQLATDQLNFRHRRNSLSLYLNLSSMYFYHAQYWGVEFCTRNRGYRRIRHCPYWVMCYIISHPPDLCQNVSGSYIISFPPFILPYPTLHLPPILLSLSPTNPLLLYAYPYPQDIQGGLIQPSPNFHSADRHKSMIGRFTMYCATMFWQREIYTPISYSPTIASASPMSATIYVPKWISPNGGS